MLLCVEVAAFQTEIASIQDHEDASTFRVRGRVRYAEAPELRNRVLDWIDGTPASRLVISLGQVEEIDTSGAAVLVEALLRGRQVHKSILLCSPSDSVLRLFRLAGFEEALDACCATPAETAQRLMA